MVGIGGVSIYAIFALVIVIGTLGDCSSRRRRRQLERTLGIISIVRGRGPLALLLLLLLALSPLLLLDIAPDFVLSVRVYPSFLAVGPKGTKTSVVFDYIVRPTVYKAYPALILVVVVIRPLVIRSLVRLIRLSLVRGESDR